MYRALASYLCWLRHPQGLDTIRVTMLGDSIPLFFPILIFTLSLWLVAEKVDKFCNRFNHKLARNLKWSYRLVPVIMAFSMIIYRINSIISRDQSHIEVAMRLGTSEYQFSDLILLFTGDGVGETALLLLLLFSLWTTNLPSLKDSSRETKLLVSNRVMSYVSACALLSFWVFFPESSYYSNDTLPNQTTLSSQGDFHILAVLVCILVIAFSAELFALVTIPYSDKGLEKLANRASLKMYIVLPLLLITFYYSDFFTADWVAQTNLTEITMMLIFFSQGLILTFICVPGKLLDSNLGVGDGRSKSFAIMAIITFFTSFILTALVMKNQPQFDSGNLYIYESIWLSASVLILISGAQILPRYGFDASPRPEYWWLRLTIVFAPAVIFIFNPLILFLIPAIWLISSITLIVSPYFEKDAKPPNNNFTILIFLSFSILITFILLSSNVLSNFILFGPLILLITNILIKSNNKSAI